MRVAAEATHGRASRSWCALIEPGVTERELQVALEATFLRSGGDFLAYESIVAAGRPQRRPALLPHVARAEGGRAAAGGRGRRVPRLRERRDAHLPDRRRARGRAADRLGDGAPRVRGGDRGVQARRRVARGAPDRRAVIVGEGLVELGVLRGAPETLLESGAITLFFPHGVGHMVGLGVRDAGLASDETARAGTRVPAACASTSPSKPRHVWTVEPGIYFVAPLLARAPRARRRGLGQGRLAAGLRRRPHRAERADHGRRLRSADDEHSRGGLSPGLRIGRECFRVPRGRVAHPS